ncbi:hypothetical protein BDN72DRAFT_905926 [Pluteus cervinus]|uniref:Uncharacterized protein n=1 Tax=Pluteus cervinus TaxID=181527 RepID=A0ACD3A0Y1_9AGAR|nr:hypothetical protein BDN72DRAFT_905926 [Pluteus cervinus]
MHFDSFEIAPFECTDAAAANISEDNVLAHLASNNIPVRWVDHAYPYAVNVLKAKLAANSMEPDYKKWDETCVPYMLKNGIPPAISELNGWWTPTEADLTRIRYYIREEDDKGETKGFNSDLWLNLETTYLWHHRRQLNGYLSTTDYTPRIIQLLQGIDVPHASLYLILDKDSTNEDTGKLFGTLRESHEHIWGSIRYLQLRDTFIAANAGTSICHSISVSDSNSLPLQLPAYQKLDLSDLESLWVLYLSVGALKVFSLLTQLHRVVLESLDTLQTFVAFLSTGTHDNESAVLFPTLQELVLVDIGPGEWLEDLCDILASRWVWGLDDDDDDEDDD